ncbi:queuosine precursor transporter [bacterium]|nr:queuosine precursor transporter [bacterium]
MVTSEWRDGGDQHRLGNFRYFDIVVAFYVTVQLASNFVAAGKVANLNGWAWGQDFLGAIGLDSFKFGAGILVFPFGYIFADVLTEVYGYAGARRAVWIGFSTQLLMALIAWMVLVFPPDSQWNGQAEWQTVFGSTPRLVAASLVAFWAGELVNSVVLSRMKILTQGRWLWTRTIGSTIVGQFVDSLLFYPLAFWGDPLWSPEQIVTVLLNNFMLKVGVEVLATPLTYFVVGWLKKNERYDAYDYHVSYNPFHVRFEKQDPPST